MSEEVAELKVVIQMCLADIMATYFLPGQHGKEEISNCYERVMARLDELN